MHYEIIRITDRPALLQEAARWFHEKWGIPEEAYAESMMESLHGSVPQWYLAMDAGRIIGGMGVIENDFHDRTDLTPNVCAVYTEPDCRCRGVAGALLKFVCADMEAQGVETLYLLTDHTAFYERHGWEFYCMVNTEEGPARMYVHRM